MGFIYFLLFSHYFFRDCNRIRKELEEKASSGIRSGFFFSSFDTAAGVQRSERRGEKTALWFCCLMLIDFFFQFFSLRFDFTPNFCWSVCVLYRDDGTCIRRVFSRGCWTHLFSIGEKSHQQLPIIHVTSLTHR